MVTSNGLRINQPCFSLLALGPTPAPTRAQLPIAPGIFKVYLFHSIQYLDLVYQEHLGGLSFVGTLVRGNQAGEIIFKGKLSDFDPSCRMQPFQLPKNTKVFSPGEGIPIPQSCLSHFKCKIQSREEDHIFWIEGQFVVFNEDMFGVIVIDHHIMYIFHRSVLPVAGG